jgi:formate hydrogenlyase subunit 3/multisubunit Na+/H+ antiporter MnhD subunit
MTPSEPPRPGDASDLRREVDLLRLDQEWERRRRSLLLGGENGSRPTKGASILALVGGLGIAGFCLLAAFYLIPQSAGPQGHTIIGVIGGIALLVGFGTAIYVAALAERYDKALRAYERRRDELTGRTPGKE